MSSSSSMVAFVILFLGAAVAAAQSTAGPSMDPAEARAVFDVLAAINHEIDWRALFPGDNPCTGGPHGLNCDVDSGDGGGGRTSALLHVVELNLGWVSDFVNNPPCAENATIHPSIVRFTRLRKLFFYECFTGKTTPIPEEISLLAGSLEHLTLQGNSALVGGIPASFGNLSRLERLVVTQNGLSGPIPTEISKLQRLQQLVLSHNRFNGSIPSELGDLSRLRILDLSSNALTGEVPASLGSGLSSLEKMDLSNNRLSGEVPSLVAMATTLRLLDLSSNNLSGGLPSSLRSMSALQGLFLGANPSLGGELPSFLGELLSLEMASLSGCGVGGVIPDSIGQLHRLNSLALDGNRLTGSVPRSLAALQRLYHLNLSGNRLSGPLPCARAFLARIGRNLGVKHNSGLCCSFEDGTSDGDDILRSLGLGQCDGSASSSSSALDLQGITSRRHVEAAEEASAATLRPRSVVWLLLAVLVGLSLTNL